MIERLPVRRLMTRRTFLEAVIGVVGLGSLYGLTKNEPQGSYFQREPLPARINGVHLPSWRQGEYLEEDSQRSLRGIAVLNPNFVAIKATQYQKNIDSTDIFPTENTADEKDLRSAINLSHRLGYSVMLAPQINLSENPGQWHGNIGANFSPNQWDSWFRSYQNKIAGYARLAEQTGVELFVAGNEFFYAADNTDHWVKVLDAVRSEYSGPVTYAAHMEETKKDIPWFSRLDVLGLNPYYKLSETDYQSLEGLKVAWGNIMPEIETFASRWNKDLLFTEIGYPSAAGTSRAPWDYSLIDKPAVAVDVQQQRDCVLALYESFWNKWWWKGVFWWAWDTNPNVGGLNDRSYTPKGKPAEEVISAYGEAIKKMGS